MTLIAGWGAEGNDFDPHGNAILAIFEGDAFPGSRDGIFAGFLDQGTEFVEQARTSHLQQVEGGFAGGEFEVVISAPASLHYIQIVVDDHGGRHVLGEQQAIGFALHISRSFGNFLFFGSAIGARLPCFDGRMGADRHAERNRGGNGFFLINLALAVHEIKDVSAGTEQPFRISYQQKAMLLQGIVKNGNDFFLQHGTEIDEDVAATDQIHARERRITEDILPGEDAHVADRFGNLVSVGHFVEEAPEAYLGDFSGDVLLVKTGARALNRAFAEVGAENLDGEIEAQFGKHLDQRDGVRVRLFSGGASRDPDAHRIGGGTIGENLGVNDLAQALENLRVAKEAGDVDQDIAIERFDLRGIAMQELEVFAEVRDLIDMHAAQDAAPDRGCLVIDEVDFAVGLQQ